MSALVVGGIVIRCCSHRIRGAAYHRYAETRSLLPVPYCDGRPYVAPDRDDGDAVALLARRDERSVVEDAAVGEFATEGTFDPSLTPFDLSGDRTMHNVVNDSDHTAYISWYAEGMRVVDFSDPTNPTEVAHYVDTSAEGSNFWGVYLHTLPSGEQVILGSDRDTGLWIFDDPVATP